PHEPLIEAQLGQELGKLRIDMTGVRMNICRNQRVGFLGLGSNGVERRALDVIMHQGNHMFKLASSWLSRAGCSDLWGRQAGVRSISSTRSSRGQDAIIMSVGVFLWYDTGVVAGVGGSPLIVTPGHCDAY